MWHDRGNFNREEVMKKYVTFVKSEVESQKVQEALFGAGFEWGAVRGCNIVANCEFPFISLNWCDISGNITCSSDYAYHFNSDEDNVFYINAEDVIANPFQLDGAKKPEKMIAVYGKEYSESTIKAALQEYVK